MKRLGFSVVALGFGLQLASVARATTETTPFELQRKGEQVCKLQAGKPEICFSSLSRLDLNKATELDMRLPDTIEIVDQVAAYENLQVGLRTKSEIKPQVTLDDLDKIASALTLSAKNRARVLSEFKRLSVRNLAVDPQGVKTVGGYLELPFYGSVYWQDRLLMQGTVNFGGVLRVKADRNSELNLEESDKINEALANIFDVNAISDSTTEQKQAYLRFLESGAREIHFKTYVGAGADVDAETVKLIQTVVGPAVTGTIYMPVLKSMVQSLANGVAKGLTDGLEQMFKGLGSSLNKN